MNRIYLDNNATTRPATEVTEEMLPWLTEMFGNPSSSHMDGQLCRNAVEKARLQVADFFDCPGTDVIFTSSGTIANNLALQGSVRYILEKKLSSPTAYEKLHLISSTIEHSSVLHVFEHFEELGAKVTWLAPDKNGIIAAKDIESAFTRDTALVSIHAANNETGAIQDYMTIADMCGQNGIVFHCDAVQWAGKLSLSFRRSRCNFMTVSAHKFHGPKGAAALLFNRRTGIRPFTFGGGQEQNIHSGTLNTAAIVGMGKACEVAADLKNMDKQLHKLRDRLYSGLVQELDGPNIPSKHRLILNTPIDASIPNTLNISFPGVDKEALLVQLDMAGISVSTGSACASGASGYSHVLEAMGKSREALSSCLRFSLSRVTAQEEIDRTIELVSGIVKKMRN